MAHAAGAKVLTVLLHTARMRAHGRRTPDLPHVHIGEAPLVLSCTHSLDTAHHTTRQCVVHAFVDSYRAIYHKSWVMFCILASASNCALYEAAHHKRGCGTFYNLNHYSCFTFAQRSIYGTLTCDTYDEYQGAWNVTISLHIAHVVT
jgi:hypothetical protein